MKNSYLINIGLVFFCLALYLFLNPSTTEEVNAPSVNTLTPASVQNIKISQANRADIAFVKHNDQWQITSPITARANANRVNLLLSVLEQQPYRQQTITPEQDLSTFGLGQSSAHLELDQTSFQFGDIDPLSKHRYVAHDGVLYLLDDTIYPLLNTVATSFIDNQLIPSTSSLTSLTLPLLKEGKPSGQTLIIKKSNGQWQSLPDKAPNKLNQIVKAWQQARAVQVVPAASIKNQEVPLPTISLQTDLGPITLHLAIEDTHTLIINTESHLAYQFPKNFHQQLLLSVD